MTVFLVLLILGVAALWIASKFSGKPLIDENRYGIKARETEEEKKKRIRMGKIFSLTGIISLSFAGYWFFAGMI